MPTLSTLRIALLACAALACSKDTPVDTSETGTPAETVGLNQILRADLLSSSTGFLWNTDLTVDTIVLREAGTAFAFMAGDLAIAMQDTNPADRGCIRVIHSSQSSGVTTTSFELDNCFVGASKNRKLVAEGEAQFGDNQLVLEIDWGFKMGTVDLSGTFTAEWKNLSQPGVPEATITLEAVHSGTTYSGRTLSITECDLELANHDEVPPDYYIPAKDSEGEGAQIRWDGHDDRMSFGASLINGVNTYSGEYWGTYTTASGSTIALTKGTLAESEEGEIDLSYGASFQDEKRQIVLTEISQTWEKMKRRFTGAFNVDYSGNTQINMGDWETDLGIKAYTVSPVTFSGESNKTTLDGPLEFSVTSLDERENAQEVWLFGNCNELLQGKSDPFYEAGTCSFENSDGTKLGVWFSDSSPTDGWVVAETTSGGWVCRNLVSGEEQQLEGEPGDGQTCPN